METSDNTVVHFVVPVKCINSEEEFEKWKTSYAYAELTKFILALNDAVKGKTNTDPCQTSQITTSLLHMLEKMNKWVDEIPPTTQPTRFGNKAFRTWYTKVESEAEQLIKELLPAEKIVACIELAPYLVGSLGNYQRIDYGTGHEASFVSLLCCLNIMGLIKVDDYQAMVTVVFNGYLKLMRKVQKVYMLEPAGSHGVWGLDDFQFLPYLWGASQLIGNNHIKPKSIHLVDIVNTYCEQYLYLGCIKFILEMKKGPFGEHSPLLNDISFVPHQLWEKVNAGLIKMYHQEVLGKFPVIQHFLFGSLLPWKDKEKTCS